VSSSEEDLAKAKAGYDDKCANCHGAEGRGNGPSAPTLADDFDRRIWPANLTRADNFRGGSAADDIYRTIRTGLRGTPMASFAKNFSEDETWHLAHWILSLQSPAPKEVDPLIRGTRIDGPLPDSWEDPKWDEARESSFALIGQVIKGERNFNPAIDRISVRALWNGSDVALRLSWDDLTESLPGEVKLDTRQPSEPLPVYRDAFAVQLSIEIPASAGAPKPYFLMGDAKRAANLWSWDKETGGWIVERANGFDARVPQAGSGLQGSVTYHAGQYRGVVRRALKNDQAGNVQVVPESFVPIAFFAWDGHNGERGTRCSVSSWYSLYLEEPVPLSRRVGIPLVVVLGAAAAEAGILVAARRSRWYRNYEAG
ncbi:MAG: ethylbenzene dehydrogenase-related protein, partial [Vicinamibacteria bacterium]